MEAYGFSFYIQVDDQPQSTSSFFLQYFLLGDFYFVAFSALTFQHAESNWLLIPCSIFLISAIVLFNSRTSIWFFL